MTAFIEKVRPFLLTDDKILREEWLFHLRDYPQVPAHLTNDLMDYATEHKGFRLKLLAQGCSFVKDETTLEILVSWLGQLKKNEKFLVHGFIENVPLPLFFQHEQIFEQYVTKDFMKLQRQLYAFEGKQGQELAPLKELFMIHMEKMYHDFSMDRYRQAVRMLNQLIAVGLYDADEAYRAVLAEMDDEYFGDFGILAVCACGKLHVHKAIPLLVQLLERQDEDLLLEEVQKALAAMQSDEVVKAVAPFVLDHEKGISVISILKHIKTPLSEKTLLDAYPKTNDIELQEFLLDALTSQFSEHIIPFIEQFIEQDSYANVFDMGEMFYMHYKTLGKSHPLLDTWHKEGTEKNARLDYSINALPDYPTNHVAFTKMEPVQVEKIGRNDPCTCGSGKKYKKCCGK